MTFGTEMYLLAISIWAMIGLTFWVACFGVEPPTRWRTNYNDPEDIGWRDALMLLPVILGLGPMIWAFYFYDTMTESE